MQETGNLEDIWNSIMSVIKNAGNGILGFEDLQESND